MIWQFEHGYASPRYWIDENEPGVERVLGKKGRGFGADTWIIRITGLVSEMSSSLRRTRAFMIIATVLPRNVCLPSDSTTCRRISW